MLWLALYLPNLSLQLCSRGSARVNALAVVEGHGREQYVYAANAEAARVGIVPGMRVSAAYAIASHLQVRARDARAEQAAIENVAAWSGQYTSQVSIADTQTLLLEIGGSARLYGGIDAVIDSLRQGLAELGFSACHALAPTPLGAIWLARAGKEVHVTDHAALFRELASLPIACLQLDDKRESLLTDMGLESLVDCLRLPRDGLARRLGPEAVAMLDRAFGRLPDPQPRFIAPHRFRSCMQLSAPVDDSQALLFPLRRLVHELCGFLLARGAGATRLQFHLRASKSPATDFSLTLASATRDAHHLIDLVRVRLERLTLAAPVDELVLCVDELPALDSQPSDFFMAQPPEQARQRVLEQLQARLGAEAVNGIASGNDHRPERAWRVVPAGSVLEALVVNRRPLWLLASPIALEYCDGELRWSDALQLEPNYERIEGGWWDDDEIARDYFIARDDAGRGFWVFRDLREAGRWYVQGVFA